MDARPWNVLFMIAHDLGRHLNCYGRKSVASPHIDRLAAQGVRLSQAFCTAPQCSPSRATFFTGRYPHSNGVMGLTNFSWDLHLDERHLAGILRDHGYHTAVIGHGLHETCRPDQMGFMQAVHPAMIGSRGVAVGGAADIASAAVRFLVERRDAPQPFYAQVQFFDPHRTPYGFNGTADDSSGVEVPPWLCDSLSAREDFASFQGAIRSLDAAVGQVLAGLEETGLSGRTLVVFTTDHGIPFPRAKCSLYDPGLEIAWIMRDPAGQWGRGRVIDALVSNLDFVPTLGELLQLRLPANIQGRGFAALLNDQAYQPRAEVFGEMTYHDYCDPCRCLRTTRHKLIVNFTSAPSFMDPSQAWRPKAVTRHPANPAFAYHPAVELYDLVHDPWEYENLAARAEAQPLRRQLLDGLCQWMRQTGDPLLNGIPTPRLYDLALAALRGQEAPPEKGRTTPQSGLSEQLSAAIRISSAPV